MSDSSLIAPAAAMRGARLLHPSTLILLGANLLPLAGVLFWSWDAFVLLMLYWLETAVIGFWTIVRVATAPRGSLGASRQPTAARTTRRSRSRHSSSCTPACS